MITRTDTHFRFNSGWPSNFHDAAVYVELVPRLKTIVYVESNERFFQAMKEYYARGLTQTFWDILEAKSSHEAKQLGRHAVFMEPSVLQAWQDRYALQAMMQVNMAKFNQHDDLRELLIGTDDLVIVEHRPDPIWGDNMDGTGKNLLGHVLMTIRAHVR